VLSSSRSDLDGCCCELMHGHADLLGLLGVQLELVTFDAKRSLARVVERCQLGSDEVANIDTLPTAHDEKIVGLGERAQASAEAGEEVIEAVGPAGNLICHALHDGKQVLRSVRQFPHDHVDVLFMTSADRDVRAQSQAPDPDGDQESEQKKK